MIIRALMRCFWQNRCCLLSWQKLFRSIKAFDVGRCLVNTDILMNKIYYSIITALAIMGMYWIFELNISGITGELAAVVLILLFAVLNCVRDMQNNKIITVVMGLFLVIAAGVLVLSGYNIITVCLVAVALILYLVLYRFTDNTYVRISIGMLLFVCTLATYYHINPDRTIPRLLVAFVIVLVLNSISELLVYFNISRCQGKSLIIIYIVIGAVSIMAPVKKEPYDWSFFVRFVQKAEAFADNTIEEIYSIAAKEDNLYKQIGYTENSRTSGGVLLDSDKIQLMVSGDTTKDNLYLKGNINNTYDGKSWSYDSNSAVSLSYDIDAWKTLYVCYYLSDNKDDLKQYIDIKRQYVSYNDIKTKALFVPVKTLVVDYGDKNSQSQSVGDNFRFRRMRKKGFGYGYVFMNIDYSNPKLQNIIRNTSKVQYNRENWSRLLAYMADNYGVKTDVEYSEFIRQSVNSDEEVRKHYLDVWSGMSEKALRLSDNIVQGSTTQLEACQKLANYISRYTYSKNIKIPADSNMIDWFLFDGRMGYCVQFSTVLTEMLRSQGIPARMTEGFMINYSNGDDEEYMVEANNAHAWVEAYMDGFGWIRIEPSRGFPVATVQSGNMYDYRNDLEDSDEAEHNSSGMAVASGRGNDELVDGSYNDDADSDSMDEARNAGDSRKLAIYLAILAAGTALIIAVILIAMYIVRIKRIRASLDPDVIIKDILRKLEKKYRKRQTGETFGEYMKSIEDYMKANEITPAAIYDCRKMKNIIEKYSYSDSQLGEDSIRQLKELQFCEVFK